MPKFSRRTFIRRSLLLAFGLVLLDSFWFEKYVIEYKHYDLSKRGSKQLKIVQISDMHFNGLKSFHKSIARKINKLKPEIVCFTGDSIDDAKQLENFGAFLSLIDKSIKKVAITGNWEYWSNIDLEQLKKVYNSYNCDLLINENISFDFGQRRITVIGLDDYVGGNPNFLSAIEYKRSSNTNVVLSHCPEYSDVLANTPISFDIDMILSGHTHGGQITLLGWAPLKPRGSGKYLKGWYDLISTKMYVSKGIGTSILPFRFGARAEVSIFNL